MAQSLVRAHDTHECAGTKPIGMWRASIISFGTVVMLRVEWRLGIAGSISMAMYFEHTRNTGSAINRIR
jgi:hypothetical protein